MKKSDLLKFVSLYNLAGSVEKVKLDSDGTSVKTTFISEDRGLYGAISFSSLPIETGEYGIHDTKQLVKMVNILEDDFAVVVNRLSDNRPVAFSFSDKNTESQVMLADLSVIPKPPPGVKAFTTDLEINIDAEFINRYIRAKNALNDVASFTFIVNPKSQKVEMIVGYSNVSNNRVRLEINTVPGKDSPSQTVSFNADYLKEILIANRDMSSAVLKVNSGGMAHIQFKSTQYEANYYLLKVTI